jgi:hypothetical protein
MTAISITSAHMDQNRSYWIKSAGTATPIPIGVAIPA